MVKNKLYLFLIFALFGAQLAIVSSEVAPVAPMEKKGKEKDKKKDKKKKKDDITKTIDPSLIHNHDPKTALINQLATQVSKLDKKLKTVEEKLKKDEKNEDQGENKPKIDTNAELDKIREKVKKINVLVKQNVQPSPASVFLKKIKPVEKTKNQFDQITITALSWVFGGPIAPMIYACGKLAAKITNETINQPQHALSNLKPTIKKIRKTSLEPIVGSPSDIDDATINAFLKQDPDTQNLTHANFNNGEKDQIKKHIFKNKTSVKLTNNTLHILKIMFAVGILSGLSYTAKRYVIPAAWQDYIASLETKLSTDVLAYIHRFYNWRINSQYADAPRYRIIDMRTKTLID